MSTVHAEKLAFLRKQARMTVDELAQAAKVGRATITRIENGFGLARHRGRGWRRGGGTRCSRALPAAVAPLQLGNHLLDRAARHDLDHDEGQQQHPQQGRHHQQQALEQVMQHVESQPAVQRPARLAGLAHQVDSTQASG